MGNQPNHQYSIYIKLAHAADNNLQRFGLCNLLGSLEGVERRGLNSTQKVKQTTPTDVALLLSSAGLHAITTVTALSADSMLHNTRQHVSLIVSTAAAKLFSSGVDAAY